MNDTAAPSPDNQENDAKTEIPPQEVSPQEVSPQVTTTQGLDEAAVQKRGLKGVLQRLTPSGRRERAVARSQGSAEVVQLVRSLQVHLERQAEVMEVLPEAIKGLSEVVEASRHQRGQLEQISGNMENVGNAMTKFNDTLFSMDNTTRRLVEGSRASEETLTQLLQKSERRFYGLAILLVVVVVLMGGTIAFLSNPDAVQRLTDSWTEPKPGAPVDAEEGKPAPVVADTAGPKKPAVQPGSKPAEVPPPSNPVKPGEDKPDPKHTAVSGSETKAGPGPKEPIAKPEPKPATEKPVPATKPAEKPERKPESKPASEKKPETGSKPDADTKSAPEAGKPDAASTKPKPPRAPLKISL